jgi:uncharacterized membrane protein YcaP (DUF421 family)
MEPRVLLITGLRAVAVYALILVVIRLLGKRTVGNFSAFDLLVALMLGEIVDEVIYGDVAFAQGAVAIGTIALLEYGNSWLSYGSRRASSLLEGDPVPIVRDGKLLQSGMRRERMSRSDVMAALRLQGIDDIHEVQLAQVEVDGLISVLRQEWARQVQKADLDHRSGELGHP